VRRPPAAAILVAMDTCRAVVFLGDERWEVREFPIPDPPPGGAVLKVEACGLCGSDLATFEGVELVPGASVFPVVPGHEVVGRVAKLAPDAELGVQEGERVGVDEILSGVPPLLVYGYSDMTGEGRLGLWGGYGEYMEILPGTGLHRMTEALPPEQLTLFEPLANGVNWVSIAGVTEGDTVVIEGPGHQGLAVLEAVLARKPAQVVVTGVSQDTLRLDTARAIGATHAVAVDLVDVRELVQDITGGQGADVVFDIASVPQTVPLAIDLARFRGRVLFAGLKHFAEIPGFISDNIVVKSLTVHGGAGYTPESMAESVAMLERGSVRSDLVVGEVLDLEHIEDAMALLARQDPSRDAVRVGLQHVTDDA
jgi:threonine dehydrogenase-like Zn-dependent dehydrogenase